MQVTLYGPNGLPMTPQTPAIVDPTFAALRTSLKPIEFQYPAGAFGHYRLDLLLTGGLTALAANAPLVAFRWAPTTGGLLAILERITATAAVTTAGSTASTLDLELIRATSFTVQDTSGASISFSTGTGRLKSSMNTSQAAIQYANGAGALTAGTRTLDGAGMAAIQLVPAQAAAIATAGSGAAMDLYRVDAPGHQHPLVMVLNEGFIVRAPSAYGTSEVARYYLSLEWAEALAY